MSLKRKRQKANKINRKEEVLNAAKTLFFKNGYRGTTIEQIAKHAGYSKRTVYLDFLNKDDLFVSVCAQGMEILLERLNQIPADELSIESFFDRFLEVVTQYSREHSKYLKLFCVEATTDVIKNCSEKLRQHIADMEKHGFGIIVNKIQNSANAPDLANIDSWEVSGIFTGSIVGIILLSLGGSQTVFSEDKLESMAKHATKLMLKGLLSV